MKIYTIKEIVFQMKKKLIFSAALVLSLALAGCGETEKENVGGTVETSSSEKANTQETDKAKEKDNADSNKEINQVVVDNDRVKATLVKIVKSTDSIFGNSYEVVFDVENKSKENIGVQARSVSVDGRMVDETIISMSQDVAAGKTAAAKLTMREMDGYEFPEFKSDLEMGLFIYSSDNITNTEEIPVKVKF